MLKSYFITALRSLRRRPGHTFINIAGLGIGLAACLVIVLYARHELSYDRFHDDADRIYQVYKERVTPTGTQVARDTWVPLLPRMQAAFPSIETGSRVYVNDVWVERPGMPRTQEEVAYVDTTFFSMFSFGLQKGEPGEVLSDLYSIVVTPEIAERYFGDADPVGKVLTLSHDASYTVAGVTEPLPSNSTLQFDMAVPIRSAPDYDAFADNWGNSFLSTYIRLGKHAAPADLEAQFEVFIADTWDAEEAERTNFRLEALPDLQNAITGNRQYAYILLGVALVILIIACTNFTNLSVARSMERAGEIGLRKSIGAHREQLVGQFLGESMLMSMAALAVALLITEVALPFFNTLYGIDLSVGYLTTPWVVLVLIGAGLGVGLLAGAYPAFVLSSFRPVTAMRGGLAQQPGSMRLRQGLLVGQFALSAILVMGTLTVWQQIEHMRSADLHFERDHLITVEADLDDFADPEVAQTRVQTFRAEIRRQAGVVSVSASSHAPGQWANAFLFAYPGDQTGDEERQRMRWAVVDGHYFDTYGIGVLEGRTFQADREADRTGVVLNKAALEAFGWTTGTGKTVRIGSQELDVLGVVDNYHYQALDQAVAPVIHVYRPTENSNHAFITVRTQPGQARSTIAAMQEAWTAVDPARALDYTFVDDQFAALYETEERMATVVVAFAVLAVVVACLGLFGLVSLMVTQRRKEISVRKVLGASVGRLAAHLSARFFKLVAVALLVATPVAYVLMQRWLQGFAVRMDLSVGLFAAACAVVAVVALATVGAQTVRAALLDPAQALREE